MAGQPYEASVVLTLSMDASELERDIERIEDGKLGLPTVSAIRVSVEGIFEEDVPVWLEP